MKYVCVLYRSAWSAWRMETGFRAPFHAAVRLVAARRRIPSATQCNATQSVRCSSGTSVWQILLLLLATDATAAAVVVCIVVVVECTPKPNLLARMKWGRRRRCIQAGSLQFEMHAY